jgi:hypothetical protein
MFGSGSMTAKAVVAIRLTSSRTTNFFIVVSPQRVQDLVGLSPP